MVAMGSPPRPVGVCRAAYDRSAGGAGGRRRAGPPDGGIMRPVTTTDRPQTISYPAPGSRPRRLDGERVAPHVVVLFGAFGDLSRRKLLPGLAHLAASSLAPDIRVVGTSLEDEDDESFRAF